MPNDTQTCATVEFEQVSEHRPRLCSSGLP